MLHGVDDGGLGTDGWRNSCKVWEWVRVGVHTEKGSRRLRVRSVDPGLGGSLTLSRGSTVCSRGVRSRTDAPVDGAGHKA